MDDPTTTPIRSAPPARPGTQDRADRGDPATPLSPPGAGAGDAAERVAKQGAAEIGREFRDVKDSAKQAAADAAGKAKDAASTAARQAQQQAGQLAAQLKEKGASLVDQQKSRAADLIGDCVAATRRAAQKLHDENDHNLAGYADAFAEGLESTGRYLREQDARRLVDDAADLARRRPEWVLGGAFVAGLAIARFLKASRPDGAAYGTYRHEQAEAFPAGTALSAGYGTGYGTGYAGGGYSGGVREYGATQDTPEDGLQQEGERALNLSGAAPGTLDAPSATIPDTSVDSAHRDNPGGPLL